MSPSRPNAFVPKLRAPCGLATLLVSAGALAAPTALQPGQAGITSGPTPTSLEFPLTRSGDTGFDVVVEYRTQDGTATGGIDYTPAPAGSFVVVPAGQVAPVIRVPVAANAGSVAGETLSLVLDRAYGVGPALALAETTTLPSGNGTVDVAIGQLDNNGRPDLVSVNANANSISVRFNQTSPGNGILAFGPATTLAAPNSPTSAALADLDGDGRQDIAVGSYSDSTLRIYRNQTVPGDATPAFIAQAPVATTNNPDQLAIADINNDGLKDVVSIGDVISHPVSVNLNITSLTAGTGPAFASGQGVGAAFTPSGLALADADLDGRIDLFVAGLDGNVRVFRNTTAPGSATVAFAAPVSLAVGGSSGALAAGDLDGDGRPDLVRANASANSISVLLNQGTTPGTISFSAPTLVPVGANVSDVLVADLNVDGRPDIAAALFTGNQFAVLRNLTPPGGTLRLDAVVTRPVDGDALRLDAGDLNGDGMPDLAAALLDTGTVALARNSTAPDTASLSFTSRTGFAVNGKPYALDLADFDLDGRRDVLAPSFETQIGPSGQNVSLRRNNTPIGSDGLGLELVTTVSMQIGTVNPAWPYDALGVDINLDGRPDLVSANYGQRMVAFRTNAITAPGSFGPASFNAPTSVDTASTGTPTKLASGDFNGDGKPDIAANLFFPGAGGESQVFLLLNNTSPGGAAAFQRFTPAATGANRPENALAVADINRDGRPDILASGLTDGTVRTLYNATSVGSLTDPFFPLASTDSVAGSPQAIAVGDFNRDGRTDVVTTSTNGGVSLLLNGTQNGSLPNYTRNDIGSGIGGGDVHVRDVNADGRPDILVVEPFADRATILLNRTGAGSFSAEFTQLPSIATADNPYAIAAGDLNGDGQPDLLVSEDASGGQVGLYRNTRLDATGSGSALGTISRPDAVFGNGFE